MISDEPPRLSAEADIHPSTGGEFLMIIRIGGSSTEGFTETRKMLLIK